MPDAAVGAEDLRQASANLARESRFDYLLVESTGISELLPVPEPRLGRRTALTFPLLAPPQKN
jgi:G3E family GTPase